MSNENFENIGTEHGKAIVKLLDMLKWPDTAHFINALIHEIKAVYCVDCGMKRRYNVETKEYATCHCTNDE